MIAIAFLFVGVLNDCFKSRRRLEAEVPASAQCPAAARTTPIAFAFGRPRSVHLALSSQTP
jgi:hypothetical protein